jgi:hypothetical protein
VTFFLTQTGETQSRLTTTALRKNQRGQFHGIR